MSLGIRPRLLWAASGAAFCGIGFVAAACAVEVRASAAPTAVISEANRTRQLFPSLAIIHPPDWFYLALNPSDVKKCGTLRFGVFFCCRSPPSAHSFFIRGGAQFERLAFAEANHSQTEASGSRLARI